MTVTAPARSRRLWGLPATLRVAVALAAIVTIVLVGLAGLFAPPASAQTLTGPGNAVGVFGAAGSQVVGAHQPVLAGQRRARAPSYDPVASGSCVAAETEPGLADAAESCSVNSFTGPTPVLLASGTEVAISKINIGDKVLATDPQTGQTAARPVTKIIVHSGKHTMVDVTLADRSMLTATDHHPFWDATAGSFTYAIALHTGDQLRKADGQLVTIAAVHAYDEDVTAYNLTVNGIHTYYAGSTPVLVHNSCGPFPDGARVTTKDALSGGEDWLGPNYSETGAGSGRFVSQDGTRVFRMGESDITGAHAGGPHVNFEELVPNPARPGRMMPVNGTHVYLIDP